MSDRLHLNKIPRVKTITKADFIEQYLKPQKPVVIERLIEDWPAFEKWDFGIANRTNIPCSKRPTDGKNNGGV